MRKVKPESARDMWWAQQQTSGSVKVLYEATKNTPEEGALRWSREMSFEEFRASEWWEPYLEHTSNLNFDSSWKDSFQVDCQDGYVEARFDKPDYKKVWWCSGEVPTGGTTPYSVYVCDDGTMGITCGKEQTVDRTVDEFLEAVRFADRARELGVSISEDGTIAIGKGEGDAD